MKESRKNEKKEKQPDKEKMFEIFFHHFPSGTLHLNPELFLKNTK